ncbi:MAG: anti-sigma factor [Alphaproteobacteria bacterium]|nr:anti-sigma factor [Alphaproteobacteria bacterium]
MAKRDDEFWRAQAGEYVLGTLSEREMRRFERLRARDAYYCDMADEWERKFGLLAEALPDIDPPPELWTRIERQIAGAPARPSLWDRLGFWRGFGLSAAALAACLLAFVVFDQFAAPTGPDVERTAVLSDKTSPAWLVTVDSSGRRLTILPLREVSIPSGKALELWLVRGKGAAPISLGLVPSAGRRALALPELAAASWPQATQLSITLEPPGGWKPGTTYGPALFAGAIKSHAAR